ncbi:MAG: phenylalanine--tRNA ligase subunit beta, partial [Salinisphaera sp.]|nr:phenylalanine--tRNA ligase subunit beta [Salinisphaera sp.]
QLPTVGAIAETTLRGVTSQGMLCSAAELGLGEEGDRLLSLDPEAVPGTPLADHLGLPDRVIDIDLTPNRGDCLSLRGAAREVAVWNRLNFNHPDCSPLPAEHEQQRDVSIENLDQCSAYAGRVLIGTDTNARTPDWLRERLRRAGLRSLGVAVDVTNYVMLELGQPMHAFDLARLAGGIQVRQARVGESLRLLDETEVVLDPSTLVIADDDGPVAMAGVMGGAQSAVSANTRDLFLESACFAPAAVAGQGRRYRVNSESLHRFERGVDPGLQQAAIERATALIQSIAGGARGPVTVAGGPRQATAAITLRRDRLQRLLGSAVAEDEIVDILTRLCMNVTAGGGAGMWQVVPPSHRHDLHLEADLIEEVARIHGYDRLQARKQPVFAAISAPPAQQRSWPELRAVLLQQGYDEAVSYSFVNADLQQALCPDLLAVDLDNPIAAPYAQMRTTLWSSLLPCWLHNRRRQQTRVRLFERGLRFARARGQEQTPVETMTIAGLAQGDAAPEHWSRAARPVDFFDVKGDIARLFGRHAQALRFTREAHAALHPGRSARIHFRDRAVGWVGQLHPKMKRVLDDYEMPYVF